MSKAELEKEKELVYKSILLARETCTYPAIENLSRKLPGTSLTLQQVLMIVGGSMSLVSLTIAVYLLYGHLRYYTRPKEQQQIIRLIVFIPFIVCTSYLSIIFSSNSGWIAPIGDYYESFAISAIYLLFCQYIVQRGEDTQNEVTFLNVKRTIEAASSQNDLKKPPSFGWVRRSWFFVLQIAVTRIITFVANEALFGVTCPLSTARSHGSIAITVVQSVCTGLAVMGVILLERRTRKTLLKGERATLKLVSFKAIIALQSTQEIIFTVLLATKVDFPTPPFYVSYNDYKTGIPNMILLFEMLIVSIMYLWSFNFGRYREEMKSGVSRAAAPPLAFLSMFVPIDIYKALISGFKSG